MTKDEIINEVIKLLNGQFIGVFGYIGQEPYRGDFFKLFAAAYNGGHSLTADSLREFIIVRWCTGDETENEKKSALMKQLLPCWHEWKYAWDRLDLKS